MISQQLGGAVLAYCLSLMVGTSAGWANAFEPPPDRSAPRSTAGGGSRPTDSRCMLDDASNLRAMALAPQTFVGLTQQANPNLWLYLPTSEANEAEFVEVSVFDEQLNGLTQFEVSLNTPGFLAIDLSQHITLSTGLTYYWTAAFVCNPNRRTEDWVVGGWIKHQPITPSAQRGIDALAPIDQVDHYISTGYWYDALTVMLPLAQSDPSSSSFGVTWDRLVQHADLTLTWVDLDNVIRISKQ